MIKKTIGGDRLGSGNRMKAELHNYERSTHNLGNVFRSTMAPGVLVPFYKKLALNGDTWSIDLTALVRTMPAIGPLFGSYKLQLDIFECPIRLYNGILHNNMTKIGMDMSKVKLPKAQFQTTAINARLMNIPNYDTSQISSSSLAAYLGIRGIGSLKNSDDETGDITRVFNAIPFLAYYDIFKNYYSNKQEEKAYVIDNRPSVERWNTIRRLTLKNSNLDNSLKYDLNKFKQQSLPDFTDELNVTYEGQYYKVETINDWTAQTYTNLNELQTTGTWTIEFDKGMYDRNNGNWFIEVIRYELSGGRWSRIANSEKYIDLNDTTFVNNKSYRENSIRFDLDLTSIMDSNNVYQLKGVVYKYLLTFEDELRIQDFELKKIDDMRIFLLQQSILNSDVFIDDFDDYPYKAVNGNNLVEGFTISKSHGKMAGLCLKTYQSDIFNNWLSTEWIDGLNGISAITAVSTASGSFTMDALNLAHKVYNMLNRIAISGGTYEDWQEAVYGEDAIRRAESPIYCGGMSGIIAFEEVVSTADTNTDTAGDQPLGSLAGKGTLVNADGGHVEIHIKEPSYIIGIASITPLIDYCQGNDFDMTELDSLDDLHKPALDTIGYQNVMCERAAWWATTIDPFDGTVTKSGGGKTPAWIEYMTSVNQVYGDFADGELSFMTLTRNYEVGDALYNGTNQYTHIKDWTTYVNPTKFNYQFANTRIDAQNFWVQIGIDAIARRKMSAKVIPNL